MTGINHMLTGGAIGAVVASPVVIPLALVSHFVLDSLPHYGIEPDEPRMDDWVWKVDTVFWAIFIVFMLFFADHEHKMWMLVGMFVAIAPDLAWVYRFVVQERFGKLEPRATKNAFNEFHSRIQKFEFKQGIWIEALFFVGGVIVLRSVVS